MAQIFIQQDELAQRFVVARACGLARCVLKTLRRRGGIAIESGFTKTTIAWPEACADYFTGISLAGDGVGTGAGRRRPAGESRNRQIEASPEEVHRADFAQEAGGKLLEDFVGAHQNPPEAVGCFGIVRAVLT